MPFNFLKNKFSKPSGGLFGAASGLFDFVDDFTTSLTNIVSGKFFVPPEEDRAQLIFPMELQKGDRPIVEFTCFVKDDDTVYPLQTYFPIPAGISFNDTSNYNTMDLGSIAAGLGAEVKAGLDEGQDMKGIASRVVSKVKSVKKEEAMALAGSLTPYNDQIAVATGTVKNPNTNVTFSGHGVRTFEFRFKMMARSEDESYLIQQINERFRHYSYASLQDDETGFMLSYPPTWLIRFYDRNSEGQFTEIATIPRIFSCYLQSVSSVFNPTTNSFHRDGAPTEIDMSLSFQETRALTRKDIQDMENDKNGNRGLDKRGRPTITTPTTPIAPQIDQGGRS